MIAVDRVNGAIYRDFADHIMVGNNGDGARDNHHFCYRGFQSLRREGYLVGLPLHLSHPARMCALGESDSDGMTE